MEWFLRTARTSRGTSSYLRCREPARASPARDSLARAAGARAALPARRERVPVAATASARSRASIKRAALRVPRRRRRSIASTTCPGESNSGMFGGNSNWRGPIWFPVNYLLIEALERYHHFYGDSICASSVRPAPAGMLNLAEVAAEISPAPGQRLPARRARRAPVPRRRSPLARRPALARARACSTSTSTATPAAASARATRPAGPRSRSRSSKTSPATATPEKRGSEAGTDQSGAGTVSEAGTVLTICRYWNSSPDDFQEIGELEGKNSNICRS